MAMEDALVLAKILHSTDDLSSGLDAFVRRRKPRVDWVRHQSRAVGDMLRMPPHVRNAALHKRGQKAFYGRFEPLSATP
jgi:2-polyprenyl-6-methoxyphenol hydroxylase-like FAD-dependent oxidoreductase